MGTRPYLVDDDVGRRLDDDDVAFFVAQYKCSGVAQHLVALLTLHDEGLGLGASHDRCVFSINVSFRGYRSETDCNQNIYIYIYIGTPLPTSLVCVFRRHAGGYGKGEMDDCDPRSRATHREVLGVGSVESFATDYGV